MSKVDLYQDRTTNGIKVSFSGLSNVDLNELKKLDSYIYELQNFGTVKNQTGPGIYDCEVFELHIMLYSYLIQSKIRDEVPSILHTIMLKLYEVVGENQELQRLQGSETIPKHLQLDHVPKQRLKIIRYSFDKLPKEFKKKMEDIEYLELQLLEHGPQKILRNYVRKNPDGKDYPILDSDIWIIFKLTALMNVKYGDIDLFSVMSSIGQKISDTARQNTGLKIKMEKKKW